MSINSGRTKLDWPQGYDRLVLPEVDSTMNEAQRRLPALEGPIWISTLRQTAGRGRRGRAWSEPAGNFAATLLIRIEEPPARLALRSFVAALALHETLTDLTGLGREAFALKWPNDVLLNGGKLSGILLETLAPNVLALGIGINLRSAPPSHPDAGFAPVSLRDETGLRLTPDQVLDALAPRFARWEERLRTYGFEPLRTAFLAQVARLGEPIVARTMNDSQTGVFETIDETGALILRTAKGPIPVPAADIFFP